MKCLSIVGAAVLALVLTDAKAGQPQNPAADSTYILTGTIRGLKDGWVYLRHGQTEKIDSAKATAGRFTFTGEIGARTAPSLPGGCAANSWRRNYQNYYTDHGRSRTK